MVADSSAIEGGVVVAGEVVDREVGGVASALGLAVAELWYIAAVGPVVGGILVVVDWKRPWIGS